MKVLLDDSVPVQVRGALAHHEVSTVSGLGWKGWENGELLHAAQAAGFDIVVIADKNLRYQQNLQGRRIAIVELWTNHRPTPEKNFAQIAAAVDSVRHSDYHILSKP